MQARDASEFSGGNIDPKQQKCLRFGRPNLPKIFEEVARIAELKQAKVRCIVRCRRGRDTNYP